MVDKRLIVTCSAPTNIATIKYWGKADTKLNTPTNVSASVTLDQNDLRAVTTVAASKDFEQDRLWLNGKEEDVKSNKRFQAVISQVRAQAQDKIDEATGDVVVSKEGWKEFKVHIVSRNNFPTAAGLASSAAGLCCLTFALAQLFNFSESFPGELTAIARQGSGSACRSLYGGFVKWLKGGSADAHDSIAVQVADEHHWPEIRAVIMVVSDAKKGTSSTSGMGTSVATSSLLDFRARQVVEARMAEQEKAYLERDFESFGRITMQESNQLHAICLDTYPPIFYMNDVSRAIVRLVHAYNEFHGEVRAAYTFDAGPNAVIYTLAPYETEVTALMLTFFPSTGSGYTNNEDAVAKALASPPSEQLLEACREKGASTASAGVVKMMYVTRGGGGPRVLEQDQCLMDEAGQPLYLA